MVDGAPEVVTLPIDPSEHLIQTPTPVGEGSHCLDALSSETTPPTVWPDKTQPARQMRL